ncbi:hypothetical protein [uncultured Algoriphagus sp.]|uniref:hypothetical protein n=1 Tax=uncultured Algoriphagus sp. TaxID=417365 RepID=UPI0025874C48|nr:hypothetical protein [uncultured Algoriphagus sp.]
MCNNEIISFIGGILIPTVFFILKRRKEKKDQEQKNLVNIAITVQSSFTIDGEVKGSTLFKIGFSIAVHNIGNAKAIVNRMFLVEKNAEGNYDYIHEFQLTNDLPRIIESGKTCLYDFTVQGNHTKDMDLKISKKSAFIRIIDASNKTFDSPRK